ncbi:hypothetical protein SDC9_196231 [bioreactor metagenome]|uniref:Uncharacterized protein n=2 Tax=root TaxID=1 RepID=A0A645IBA5_9ZZZZ
MDNALDLDLSNWIAIDELRRYLMKDTYTTKSLFTRIKDAADEKDYAKVSELQLELDERIATLRKLYSNYKKNLLDF